MLALVVTVPAGEAELAADALWALGVMAVEERSASEAPDTGTEDHLVELWTSVGEDPDAVVKAAEGFPARWRWRTVEVDDAVVDSWRQHAVASWITPGLVIAPAWLDLEFPDDATAIRIEPGVSFGLGDHPTTVVSLRALQAVIWPDATVLDVGCGSGVIGITAAVLGSPYVEAIDISHAAIQATIDNAERNGVTARVAASTRPLHEIDEQFDIVVANILAPALIELAPELVRHVQPSGVLIVSGLLEGASEHVEQALRPMQVVDRLVREGWTAVVLRC